MSEQERIVELKPVKESNEDFDALETRLKEYFKREIYIPILKELNSGVPLSVLNSKEDEDLAALIKALNSGRVTFNRGRFSGRFTSNVTKELKSLGAKWDRKTASFSLPTSSLPVELKSAVAASDSRFQAKIAGIDKKLAQILPEKIAQQFSATDLFDRTLWKTNGSLEASMKGLTVSPKVSRDGLRKIADEWQTNLKKWIQNFTEEEILKLRKNIKKSVFAGNRYDSAAKTIQRSFGVSADKAKFLARQETSLLMAKFKETRYIDAGVNEYRWGCVAGSKDHPVRPSHKRLEGKIFRWDTPPITTAPGQPARRNNPGEDFGCRCFPRPIVRFKKDDKKL